MFIMNNWVLIDCNHSAEILYGLPHARLIGTSPLGLAPECQPDGTSSVALLEAMDARVRRGEAVNFVWRQERHDGVVLDVDVSLNALIYEGIACTQAIVRDVTEKLQQQALLREVTALQSAILESAAVSIISTTPDGLITSFNRGAENMLGYRAEEMVQRVTPALIHMPDEVVARAQELSTELGVSLEPGFDVFVIRSRLGLPNAYEWTYVRKDGSLLPVLLTISTLTDQQGVTVGYLGIATDISANKKVEAELLNLKERAEAANQAKSQFLATMSHEIRTPLNGVLGMAQLLLMPDIAEQERQEYARTILHSGQTLLTLLNDILDLSKIEAGKMEIAATVFEPGHLVEETTALFAQLAQTKGLTLDTDWHCPQGARYKADSARLRQMLSNLIGNAIKFTPRGFVRIEASEIERKENHALLEFSVTDSGIGIPPDKQDILFQPFSQVDSSTTREFGGTGLGLSIIRSLAKLMGGEVGVASEVGKGSRFWFRIQADILLKGEDSRHVERSAEFKPDTQATAGGTEFVLVVEDNPTNRKVVEALLGKLGIQVKSVENGQEAVDGIRQGLRPSLILMDIQMPVMDGLKATQLIRRGEEESGQPHLVIIALTAGAFEEDRQRCIDAGMDDFLTKPISIRDLESVLAKWMVKDKQTENLT
jgi:PAS domain S-box-containing protein